MTLLRRKDFCLEVSTESESSQMPTTPRSGSPDLGVVQKEKVCLERPEQVPTVAGDVEKHGDPAV